MTTFQIHDHDERGEGVVFRAFDANGCEYEQTDHETMEEALAANPAPWRDPTAREHSRDADLLAVAVF